MCEIIRGEMCEGRNVPLDLRLQASRIQEGFNL